MDSLNFDPRPWLPVLLDGLPEQESEVLSGVFYEGLTVRQIAVRMKLSKTQVHRLKAQALERLRTYYEAIEELRP